MLIKSLRELAESGGSNLATIEKYMRQSFSGAADINNLTKLIRLAAHRAVTKVFFLFRKYLDYFNKLSLLNVFIFIQSFRVYCNRMASTTQWCPGKMVSRRNANAHLLLLQRQFLPEIPMNRMAILVTHSKMKKKICTIVHTVR